MKTFAISGVLLVLVGLSYPTYQLIQDGMAINEAVDLPCGTTRSPSREEFAAALGVVQTNLPHLTRQGQRQAFFQIEILRRKLLGCL